MEGRKHHRGGKPENFRGEGGSNRGHGHRGGGLGKDGGRGRKKGKFQMHVAPQSLRFTQDSISNKFKPPFEYLYINIAVQQIQQKLLSPAQMPPLNVVNHKGILWSLDNRRLWVFRKAGVELITVNLVPENFSPRSCEFFTNLNANLDRIYSEPTYYPRVRSGVGSIAYPDHVKEVRITSVQATLPSFPIRSPQHKFIPKSTTSDIVNITNDAAKEERSYRLLSGFKKEVEGGKPGNISCLDRIYGKGVTGSVSVGSFLKPPPEPKMMPSVSTIPKPKFIPNGHQHHHIIYMGNHDAYVPPPEPKMMPSVSTIPKPKFIPNGDQHHYNIYMGNHDAYMSLPSSEKGAAAENGVIGFMNNLFRKVWGFMKHCMPCLAGDEEFLGF